VRTAVDVVAGMVEVTVVVTHANSKAVEVLELEWVVVVLLEELVVDELEDECEVVVDDEDVELVDEEELLV